MLHYTFRKSHLEAYFWLVALIYLGVSNVDAHHYTLCLFSNLGFEFCPGCGIGHSISYTFKGRFLDAWNAHPLGVLAIGILVWRSYSLVKPDISFLNKNSK